MNEIQKYQHIDNLTAEILILKQQTAQNIIEIGKRLITVKESLPHGEFGKYLAEKVDFTDRTAQKFIKVAEEFANTNTYSDLPVSKLYALLDLPPEEREDFIKSNPVDEMSTRELQKVIKEKQNLEEKLKESKEFGAKAHELAHIRGEERDKALKTLEKEKESSQKSIYNLQKSIIEANKQLSIAKESGNNEDIERLQTSLQESQNDLDASAKRIDELEEKLKDKPIDVTETVIEKVPEKIEKELQELRQKAIQNNDQFIIKFSVYFDELVKNFQNLLGALQVIENVEVHEKYKNAVNGLLSKMSERL